MDVTSFLLCQESPGVSALGLFLWHVGNASGKFSGHLFEVVTLLFLTLRQEQQLNRMQNKEINGSLSGIVDKMNKAYNGLIGEGFNLGLDRRVIPVMIDGAVVGWKMQRLENNTWVDLDETPFETMAELIEYYKKRQH